jgi:hypothetical protein
MILKRVAIAVLAVSLATAAAAQEAIETPVKATAVQAKSLQLTKVVLDTDSREFTARVKGGTWCVFPSNVKMPREKKTLDYERFDNLFANALKANGYAVVNNSADMFAAENETKGDLLIGVNLRPSAMNVCSSVAGVKGDVTLDAEWQLFDRSAGKVVAKFTTSGQGVLDKFATDGLDQLINKAFTANLEGLLKQDAVKQMAAKVAVN